MFCTQCGTQIPDGSKFCTGCGAKLEVAPVAPVATPEPEVEKTPVVEEVSAPVEETPTPVVEETPAPVAEPVVEEASAPAAEAVVEETPAQVAAPVLEKKLFCTACGKELPVGTKFCTGCGAKVEIAPVASAPVEEVPTPVVEETPAPAAEAVVEEAPAPAAEPVVEETPAPAVEPVKEEAPAPAVETVVEETPAPAVEPVKEEAPAPAAEAVVEETPAPAVEQVVEETPAPAVEPVKEETSTQPSPVSLAVPPEKPAKKGKGGVVAIIIIILLLLAAGGAAVWYFVLRDKPIDLFEVALNEGRYEDAEEIHDDLDGEDEEKADELIASKLSTLFDEYSAGKFESFEAFEKDINAIYEIAEGCDELQKTLEDAAVKMMAFSESNNNYKSAKEAFENKNYAGAVRTYQLVYEKDPNYEEAQNKLAEVVEAAIVDADALAASGEYDRAKASLEGVKAEFASSDNQLYKDIESKINEYNSAADEAEKQELYNGIEELIANKDYQSAINNIKTAIDNGNTDSKLDELYSKAANEYVDERMNLVLPEAEANNDYSSVLEALVIAEQDGDDERISEVVADRLAQHLLKIEETINNLLANKEIDKAIILLEYLDEIVDNETVDNAINTYKAFADTKNWQELAPIYAGEQFILAGLDVEFESGNKYANAYEAKIDRNSANNYAAIGLSNLGGEYKSLHMVIGTFPMIEELESGTMAIEILANGASVYHVEGVNLGATDLDVTVSLGEACESVIVKLTLETPEDGGYTIIEPCIGKLELSKVDLTAVQIPTFSVENFNAGTESNPESGTDEQGSENLPDDGIVDNENPDGNVENPDAEVENPDAEVENPDANVENPDAEVENPDANVENPDASVENPDANVENPDAEVENPDASVENPDAEVENPDAGVDSPSMEGMASNIDMNAYSAVMPIDDAYVITGRGLALTGTIAKGTISSGSTAVVYMVTDVNTTTEVEVVVGDLESFREIVSQAGEGDSVGVFVTGIEKVQIQGDAYLVIK